MSKSSSASTKVGSQSTVKPAASAGSATAGSAAASPVVPCEKIAQLAYQKWLSRGCTHGNDKQDWQEAELELTRRITEEVVHEANVSGRVRAILSENKLSLDAACAATVAGLPAALTKDPERHWSAVVKDAAFGVLNSSKRGGQHAHPTR